MTPQYVIEGTWADYRRYEPTFLDQTSKVPDEGFGMALNIPSITSAASVAQQTQNSTVANSSPSGAYLTSSLVTFSGEIDVSQLLFDQAGPVGIDRIIDQQLDEALQTQLDSYTITQALSTAGSKVSGASVWSNANAWGDLAKASANMRTAAGAVLPPTHLFASPTFFSWMLAQVDDQHRPLLTPQPAGTYLPVSSGPDGDAPAGWTGTATF